MGQNRLLKDINYILFSLRVIGEVILDLFRKYVWLKAVRLQCLNQVGDLYVIILSETLSGEVDYNLAIFV